MARSLFPSVVLLAAALLPQPAASQISDADIAQVAGLAEQLGVPQAPLVNKFKEGLAKGYPAARVHGVVKELAGHLVRARELLGTAADNAMGARAVVILGEAFFRGVTRDEMTELRRLLEQDGTVPAADRMAMSAQTWATLREGGVAASTGLPLVADAVRQGAREAELARLAREALTTRRADGAPARPRTERPAAPERPERPATPERPAAPDRPLRPERVEPPPARR